MEETKLLLLIKLTAELKNNADLLEKSYNSSNKEDFNNFKKSILEIQSKIKFLFFNSISYTKYSNTTKRR